MRAGDAIGLPATEAAHHLAGGGLRAGEYAQACLDHAAARDDEIGAFAVIEGELVRRQAQAVDAHRQSGRPVGPLHGLPVGVQDLFDTVDLPSTNGTALDAGRRPRADATCVSRLRGAGAIILGKTSTTELGHAGPGGARNPRDPARTAGGAGSGSAAAVASGMVPLAIAVQSTGAVTWSASCCGVVGFKPSHGLVPRTGVLRHCATLDTVGGFARTVEDVALLVDAIAGHDPADADTTPCAPPRLLELARSDPPLEPLFAWVSQSAWSAVEPATGEGFAELGEFLGERWEAVELPDMFADGIGAHQALLRAGMAHSLRRYQDHDRDQLHEPLVRALEEGRSVAATSYLSALDWREVLYAGLEQVLDRFDVIVTPASAGEAPAMQSPSGEAAFASLWTLLGVPTVTLPLLEGPEGLPVGVQLVGRRGYDGRLLRTANWLLGHVAAEDG